MALIDEFTTYYDNLEELGEALNEILDLRLRNTSVKKFYIIKRSQKDKLTPVYTEYLPIRYSFDSFDYESVMNNYIDYLKKHDYLLYKENSPLGRIRDNYMRKYDKISLSETDIESIAQLYLKNRSGSYNYDRFRAAYFTLLDFDYKIKMKSKTYEVKQSDRTDLTKYNPNDEFFEYLIKYSKIGDEEKANAMDILASESIENINRNMYNPDYGLFDNENVRYKRNFGDDALLLQALTNMTIQELVNVINNYQTMQNEKNKSKGRSK